MASHKAFDGTFRMIATSTEAPPAGTPAEGKHHV